MSVTVELIELTRRKACLVTLTLFFLIFGYAITDCLADGNYAMTGDDCIVCHDGNGIGGAPYPNPYYTPDQEPDGNMKNEHHVFPFVYVARSCYSCHNTNKVLDSSINYNGKEFGICINCHFTGNRLRYPRPKDASQAHIPKHDNAQIDSTGCSVSCHADNIMDEHYNNGWTCFTCHLAQTGALNPTVVQSVVTNGSNPNNQKQNCLDCHDNQSWKDLHQYTAHPSTPPGDWVQMFYDDGHDSAGENFWVYVDCETCHTSDLRDIHANDCFACHATQYFDSVNDNTWQGGCQQGACHTVYHADSATAHLPTSSCGNCHYSPHSSDFRVDQYKCVNCHVLYGAGDTNEPITTIPGLLTDYYGPAILEFSMTDSGPVDLGKTKVEIGRTFYKLNGGPQTGAMFITIPDGPGATEVHNLEYWSVDQSGNEESPHNFATFNIHQDTTPPTTTSNAQASYYQGAVITLIATDTSTAGVKETRYTINGGSEQVGTTVYIPPTSGTFNYTLEFWSIDWAGNEEVHNSVDFTVTSGSGTIRLVWGTSDVDGSPCPSVPDADASWTISSGSFGGPVVDSSSDGCPDWSGVNDIVVDVSGTDYFVRVDWWNYYDQTDCPDISITQPGETILCRF